MAAWARTSLLVAACLSLSSCWMGCEGDKHRRGARSALPVEVKRDIAAGQAAFERGYAMEQQGRHEEALAAYSEAIKADPAHGLAHVHKAEMQLLTGGDRAEIRALLERAVELLPDNPRALMGLGDALVESGEAEKAEQHWAKALALRPSFADARLRLATVYKKTGRQDRAVTELELVIRDEPKNVLARTLMAELLESSQRYADAAVHVEQAANAVGKSAPLYRRAGELYDLAGRKRDANRMRDLADDIDPPAKRRKYRPLLKRGETKSP